MGRRALCGQPDIEDMLGADLEIDFAPEDMDETPYPYSFEGDDYPDDAEDEEEEE